MALQFWLGALVAGRAMQLALRVHGPGLAQIAFLAILGSGPLYIVLLPLMDILFGVSRQIDWSRDMPGFNHVRKMGHLLTASAAVGLALAIPSPGQHLGVLEEVSSSLARSDDLGALSSGRMDIWSMATALIADAPLTGYGWGQFLLIQIDRPISQVHNMPLELILGLGIPMGLLALGLMTMLWMAAHRRAAQIGAWVLPALCLLDTMAVYSLVSGTYYYGVPVVLTGLAWGICLSVQPPGPQT